MTFKVVAGFCVAAALAPSALLAQSGKQAEAVDYKVLATSKTSTMQTEMQAASRDGYRFGGVMGGETSFGGSEVVVVMVKDGAAERYDYRLLAASKTSLSPAERRVLALFPPGVSRASLAAAADRVRFQRGLANRFRDGLIRSGQWEPHIRRVFRERGLPEQLGSLPHVESSFNPLANSHAGAAGLWQFMPSTGARYMRIDRDVDERYDPFR